MNRVRVLHELPVEMATWLQTNATNDTWERVARDLAVALAVRALGTREYAGEAGYNRVFFELRRTDPSPTIRHVAATLGCNPRGRAWTIRRVVLAVTEHLELYTGGYKVRRRVQEHFAPGSHEGRIAA